MALRGGCLTEEDVVGLLGGKGGAAGDSLVRHHLGECADCATLLAAMRDSTASQGAAWADQLRPRLLLPGTVLAQRYVVRRSLGIGAMGEVHEAEDRLLGETVALKTLNARVAGDPRAVARLKREVAIAHRVTHPNVCRIFDLGTDESSESGGGAGGTLFLTMEYLEGETLAAHLARRGPMPAGEAWPLLLQLADGLAAAHAGGVVHRDLKGQNIMLVAPAGGAARAVITDFGLAGWVAPGAGASGSGSSSGPGRRHGSGGASLDSVGFAGTPAYASPERLAGGAATPASDVYSLGLIALEMLAGPLPPVWQRLIGAMTHPRAAERLQDGRALWDALQAVERDRTLAAPAGATPAAGRARLPIRALAAAAVLAAIAGGGSIVLWRAPVAVTPAPRPPSPASPSPASPSQPSQAWEHAPPSAVPTLAVTREQPARQAGQGTEARAPRSRRPAPASARRPIAAARASSAPSDLAAPATMSAPASASGWAGGDDIVRELPIAAPASAPARGAAPARSAGADLVDAFAGDAPRPAGRAR